MPDPIKLYYWPVLPGRGEFVRLVLEAGGLPYVDVARSPERGGSAAVTEARGAGLGDVPAYAPPICVIDGIVLSQTAVICDVLAARCGLTLDDPLRRAQVQSVFLCVMDVVSEAHATHHPIGTSLYFEDQTVEAKKAAAAFRTERLPNWLAHFARVLAHGGGDWLFGGAPTYVDLGLAHVLDGLAYAFPKGFARAIGKHSRLLELRDRAWALERVEAYRSSDRWVAFNEAGLFRHYPELDAA